MFTEVECVTTVNKKKRWMGCCNNKQWSNGAMDELWRKKHETDEQEWHCQ